MNVEASAADFRRAIAIASRATEKRSSIPILSNLRCRANGSLELTGTDLDIAITARVPRKPGSDADFTFATPSSVASAIGAAGGETVLIQAKDKEATFTSDALSLTSGSLPAEDFPRIADISNTLFSATLSRDHIALIKRITGAISTEETRYYLNGINLKHIDGQTYRAAATDGHRLYQVDLIIPDATGDIGDIIIPRKAVALLVEFGSKATDGVRFTIGTTAPVNRDDSTAPSRTGMPRLSIALSQGKTTIGMEAKLIDGTFPDYARVIPAKSGKQMLFKTADLRRALAAISGHSRDSRATKIVLNNDGTATLSAAYISLDFAASIVVPCEHSGGNFLVGFNGGYLSQIIDASSGDEVLFDTQDAASPMLVRNPADTAWTGVLMPMRVD